MKVLKPITLFSVGGALYITIEFVWRAIRGSNQTQWVMFIVGGIAFLLIGAINEYLPWDMSFWKQCLIGTSLVLADEFISGVILNIWLCMNVWDYSNTPFNVLGQVCLPFAFAWYALSAVGIVLDDYLRYWIFKEEKPRYNFKIK